MFLLSPVIFYFQLALLVLSPSMLALHEFTNHLYLESVKFTTFDQVKILHGDDLLLLLRIKTRPQDLVILREIFITSYGNNTPNIPPNMCNTQYDTLLSL